MYAYGATYVSLSDMLCHDSQASMVVLTTVSSEPMRLCSGMRACSDARFQGKHYDAIILNWH